MKILFSCGTLTSGGAERVISILSNWLAEHGHVIEILLYYNKPIWYDFDENIVIHSDEEVIGKANPIKHLLYRHRYFKNSNADVIISFLAPINMVNLVANFGVGKKMIVADRNDPRYTPTNPFIRFARDVLYNFADGIVFQSKKNKEYFSKSIQNKSKIILNPVNVGDYKGVALECNKKNEIVSVARVIPQKNPQMLLEAFACFSKNHPEYTLSLYGDGFLQNKMRELSKELGISDKVSIPGPVHDVFEKIKTAKLFVLSSHYEGMPNALIEAMCVGIPVISTKVSGAVDIIKDGHNGRLVDCGNADQLAQVMAEVMDDYAKAEECARAALNLNEELCAEKIIQEWIEYINQVTVRPLSD